jgi:hypothetical protein
MAPLSERHRQPGRGGIRRGQGKNKWARIIFLSNLKAMRTRVEVIMDRVTDVLLGLFCLGLLGLAVYCIVLGVMYHAL